MNQGDLVTLHVTNIEETRDELHGIGIGSTTSTSSWTPARPRRSTSSRNEPACSRIYCTNFCSALHQEMQGYLLVKPKPGAGKATTSAAPRPAAVVAANK